MTQQPMPGSNTDIKDLIPGDIVQVYIKVIAGSRKPVKIKRVMDGYTCAFTALE